MLRGALCEDVSVAQVVDLDVLDVVTIGNVDLSTNVMGNSGRA